MKRYLILILSMTLFGLGFSIELKSIVINITDDAAEWPPYIYYERIDGEKTNKLTGFTVDIIKRIFEAKGIKYTITLLPWKRALKEVEKGQRYQMILNATYNESRGEKFLFSIPFYHTHPYYFYNKKVHPNGLNIKTLNDLKNYRINGILGYNYKLYGLNSDFVDTTAKNFLSAIRQLQANYYDLFPEAFEILSGYFVLNNLDFEKEQIGYKPIPELEPTAFYVIFTKNKLGSELKKVFDNGLKKLKENGEYNKVLNKYIKYNLF